MLRFLAVTVWLAWLGLLALMAGMVIGCVRHPHYLPMSMALVILIGSGLALIVGGLRCLMRGPGRSRALTCLLLGAVPLELFAGHAMYGLVAGYGRNHENTWALKLLIPLGESIMDLEARFRYPERTFGEKVVMISTPIENAPTVVAAMDRHVVAQEARLGRPIEGRVHWVRGSLLGIEPGKALFGLCLGSEPGEGPPHQDGPTSLDLHEVAHCVIQSVINPRSDPPALLSEGYAEAHSGLDPIELAIHAWEDRDRGSARSLRELTGPDWYGRHEGPVYVQGAALTDYILRTFGPDRLIRLYTTCQPATFADDCRRILGVSLDELDAAYRADIDRTLTRIGSPERWRLGRLELDPEIDRDSWEAFLDEYFAAIGPLLAPYEHVRATTEQSYTSESAGGAESTIRVRCEIARSGPDRSERVSTDDRAHAYLAHPSRPIEAHRDLPGGPWEVEARRGWTPEEAYRYLFRSINRSALLALGVAFLRDIADELSGRRDPSSVFVAGFERLNEGGSPIVRIRFEDRTTPSEGWPPWSSFTADLAIDDDFVVVSHEFIGPNGRASRAEYEYDRYDGIPVFSVKRSAGKTPDGTRFKETLAVVERRFGPVPESEFDPARFLEGPCVVVEGQDASRPAPGTLEALCGWYRLPLIAGGICLIGGSALGLRQRGWAEHEAR